MKQPQFDPNQIRFIANLINRIRLVWKLFFDGRVALWLKSILPLSLLYLVLPIDIIPDFIIGVGQLDDLGVVLMAMTLFVRMAPTEIVKQYMEELGLYDPDDVSDANALDSGDTVTGDYRVLDDDNDDNIIDVPRGNNG